MYLTTYQRVLTSNLEIISLIIPNSEILKREVCLIARIDRAQETTKEDQRTLANMKVMYFVRPTQENIDFLCAELKQPKYSQYYLCKPDLPHDPGGDLTLNYTRLLEHHLHRYNRDPSPHRLQSKDQVDPRGLR